MLLKFLITPLLPPPNFAMSVPVVTIAEDMKEKNQVKTEIGVGAVV